MFYAGCQMPMASKLYLQTAADTQDSGFSLCACSCAYILLHIFVGCSFLGYHLTICFQLSSPVNPRYYPSVAFFIHTLLFSVHAGDLLPHPWTPLTTCTCLPFKVHNQISLNGPFKAILLVVKMQRFLQDSIKSVSIQFLFLYIILPSSIFT